MLGAISDQRSAEGGQQSAISSQRSAESRPPEASTFGQRLRMIRGETPPEQMAVELGISAIRYFVLESEASFLALTIEEILLVDAYCRTHGYMLDWVMTGEGEMRRAYSE